MLLAQDAVSEDKKWLEVSWLCSQQAAPILEELAFAFGASSVSFFEGREQQQLVADNSIATHQLWESVRIVVLLGEELECTSFIRQMTSNASVDLALPDINTLENSQWQHWQQYWSPIKVTDDFWISPSWCELPAGAKDHIVIDPGQAFGTGEHATTWLCVRWLCQQELVGCRVLDYGCGSGLLALVAAKCGASARGVDIDKTALKVAKENMKRNNLNVEWSKPPVNDDKYDIVLANILLEPLQELKSELLAQLKLGANLVLSGILTSQVAALQQSYPEIKWQLMQQKDQWAMIKGQYG